MSSNTDLVRKFCADLETRDIDRLMTYFTEDAVYYNSPVGPTTGLAAIRALLEEIGGPATSVEIEFLGTAESGNSVFTERVDRLVIGGKTVELPVAGVFEVRDGKISSWRDYFDMATWTRQVAAG